ncbi:MAG: AraC family transcriptional regulator [Bacteroidota bacterium]
MYSDDLSIFSLEQQTVDFPTHYHETYCISLIKSGIERLEVGGNTHFAGAGDITITHPNEVHAQPLFDRDIQSGFDTIYITSDLVKFFTESQNQVFLPRRIHDLNLSQRLQELVNCMNRDCLDDQVLSNFLMLLHSYAIEPNSGEILDDKPWIDSIKTFVDHNLTQKITLDEMASVVNLNKYTFNKHFKSATGMSPINYVLMQKVFQAKKFISSESCLTSLAYQFDFTDMAHFSKTFKRYIGISPKQYQNRLITK